MGKHQTIKISEIKLNPNNPRLIKDDKFKKLVQSIKEFPEMLDIRPIVVNIDMVILGGNMRFKACKEAGLKEVPIIIADNLTEEQQREFLIKDNTSGGEWDFEMLANEWDSEQLEDWGLDIPSFATDVDYSILDDDDVSEQLENMTDGVKKAIQIEFEAEHYEEAYALVKFWREKEAYVGGMIMEYLKAEKEKI
jgi:ParB-like chromosome segregation protein Spo0J